MDRPGSGEPGRMSKNDYQSLMSLVDVLVKHCPRLSKIQAPWRLGPLGIELPASLFLHNHRMKETLKELTVGYKVMVGSALQELVLPNLETLILESICVPRWQSLIGETQSITPSMSFPKLKHFIVRRCVMSQVLLDTFVKSIRQPLKSMTVLESRFMQSNGTSRRIPWFDNCKCPEVYGSMEHLSLDCTDGFTGYDHPLAPLKSLIQLDVRLCGVYHTRQLFHLPPSIKTLYIHHVRGPIPDSPFDVIWALSALLNELPSKKCRVTKIHLAWTFKKQDLVLWGILSAFIIGKCKKNGVEFIVEPYYGEISSAFDSRVRIDIWKFQIP
ncbi:hypothetical protein SISSUDRAFT_257310 [Sistotremastrum suecicum HHB10207 ss-3]|uniref:F-box domain-containing protein n=1 Tax=Sistotremastrum suecicum HHB10207 ss-3 TaxID=1314776 RepID=A0A166GCV3_9AGAM|nr:hypothetical protein SISSUDRAFT_257310 [Sistotremastrum suecicum HHB10207 ss-3]